MTSARDADAIANSAVAVDQSEGTNCKEDISRRSHVTALKNGHRHGYRALEAFRRFLVRTRDVRSRR